MLYQQRINMTTIREKEEYIEHLKAEHKKKKKEEKERKMNEEKRMKMVNEGNMSPQLANYYRLKEDPERHAHFKKMQTLNMKKRYYENEELRQKMIKKANERYWRLKAG